MWENEVESERSIHSLDQDLIGVERDVIRLVDAIGIVQPPFTIGVVGPWGSGKTSVLNLVRTELKNRDCMIDVWFDAWKYARSASLLPALIHTLRKAAVQLGSKSARKFQRAARIAMMFGADVALRGISGRAGVGLSLKEAKTLVREFGAEKGDDVLAEVIAAEGLHKVFDDAVRELLSSCQAKSGAPITRVCVFVDDLDRCSPEQSMRLIEDMHLFLSSDSVIFVLGLSTESVRVALRAKYGDDVALVDEYLHKLITLEVAVPASASNLKVLAISYSEELYGSKAEEQIEISKGNAWGFSVADKSNPRLLKRLIRHLALQQAELHPIYEKYGGVLPGSLIAGCAVWPEFLEFIAEPSRNANHFALWFDATNRPQTITSQSIPPSSVEIFERFEKAGNWYMDLRRLSNVIWTDDRSVVEAIVRVSRRVG